MYFHRTVPDRTAMVWRRCSVAVDHWRCRPDVEWIRLLGRIFIKKRMKKTKNYLPKKFVKWTVR